MLRVNFVSFRALDRNGNATANRYPASIEWQLRFADHGTVSTRMFSMTVDQAEAIECKTSTIEAQVIQSMGGRYLRGARLQRLTGRVDALYTGIPGKLSGELIAAGIEEQWSSEQAISEAAEALMLSPVIRQSLAARSRSPVALLRAIHRPDTVEQGERALAFARQCAIDEVRHGARASVKATMGPARFSIDTPLIEAVAAQPETLSESQRQALNTIRKAINQRQGARILLNGDVGSGKTLVFCLATVAVARASKGLAAILVPNEIVARQIHGLTATRFADLKPQLCTAEAGDIDPEARLLVGTQALLHRTLTQPLSVLVIDEQHKFSVDQRMQLVGESTHVIEASATPIPRSLALALFDGWTQARISGSPVTKAIDTHILRESERNTAIDLVRHHLQEGRRCIFLYPRVNGKGSVIEKAQALAERFPDRVAVIHGKLKAAEKEAALLKFRSGQAPIAVASTAVEVGVDVPDVGLMVISEADRFGLTQLHQLRGRLVRNGGHGDFVMMTAETTKRATLERLQALRKHSSGFDLAEADLKLRGFGDVLGDMQTGKSLGTFKLTRLVAEDFL
jgi:ATP-dependent DNA helicase RecG